MAFRTITETAFEPIKNNICPNQMQEIAPPHHIELMRNSNIHTVNVSISDIPMA